MSEKIAQSSIKMSDEEVGELSEEPLNTKGQSAAGRKSKQLYKAEKIAKVREAKAKKYKGRQKTRVSEPPKPVPVKKTAPKPPPNPPKKDPRGQHLNDDLLSAFF